MSIGIPISFLHRFEQPESAGSPSRPNTEGDTWELACLRRDLAYLLNTRCRNWYMLEAFPQLSSSVLAYGITDFTGMDFGSAQDGIDQIARFVRQAIQLFEPRLKVSAVRPRTGESPQVFDVDAQVLHNGIVHDGISIAATLDSGSGRFRVERVRSI